MESWPHAPARLAIHPGAYIITASTLHGEPVFRDGPLLDALEEIVLNAYAEAGWELQAWAFFPNHYHLVMLHDEPDPSLARTAAKAHGLSAIRANSLNAAPGRKVWHRYWETRLTYERSYLARLAYVHANPRRHGLVDDPRRYRWCSASWFEERGDAPFVRTVGGFDTSRVSEREIELGDWRP